MGAGIGPVITVIIIGLAGTCEGCKGFSESVVAPSAQTAADAVDRYCDERRNYPASRERWVAAVNERTESGFLTPFDCDRDGEPDFPVPVPGSELKEKY